MRDMRKREREPVVTAQFVTAATNFALSLECAFFAGLTFGHRPETGSARWYWSLVLSLLAVAALLGGLDHGFLETPGVYGEITGLTRPTWLLLGLVTFFMLLTGGRQFLRRRPRQLLNLLAAIQLLVFISLLWRTDSFTLVIVNYVPVALLFVAANAFHAVRPDSDKGSWLLVVGLSLLIGGSIVQALAIDRFAPLDRNGLYHVIAMIGIVFLYFGGLALKDR